MSIIKGILISLRPKQWIKNLFVFVPLLFSGSLFNVSNVLNSCLSFFYFCLISSAIYLINDVVDKEKDKLHPVKSKRPIAQGALSAQYALLVSVFLIVFVMVGIVILQNRFIILIVLLYFCLNLFYALFLKDKVILDVISIAFGFELRIWAGALAINILPSEWLQICTFLLALFLGFAKRRAEMLLLKSMAAGHRKILGSYRLAFLDQLIAITSGIIILAYALYSLSWEVIKRPRGNYLIYSTTFVVYGVFRYLYLMYTHKKGGDPTEIVLYDFPLLINLLLWALYIFLILYW